MKDAFSKVTFGFFMAQFFPGAIVVLALTVSLSVARATAAFGPLDGATEALETWVKGDLTHRQFAFLLLSIGAGMLIHGLNWAVIAYFENVRTMPDNEKSDPQYGSVNATPWSDQKVWSLIATGPIWLAYEIASLLLRGRNLRHLGMDENVTKIPKDSLTQFQFIEDFYLHFSQFYLHSAIAVGFAGSALVLGFIPHLWSGGQTPLCAARCQFLGEWLATLTTLWLLCGALWTLGRIQLQSMFCAEYDLIPQAKPTRIPRQRIDLHVRK